MRQEREKIRKVPGEVDSEKIQGTDGETALMHEEGHHFSCKKQKGREVSSRCRKVHTLDGRKLRESKSDSSSFLWVVGGKVTF